MARRDLRVPEELREPSDDERRLSSKHAEHAKTNWVTTKGRAMAISMDFAYGVIGAVLIGLLLDWWLKTTPTFVLIGTGLGVIGGGYRFIKDAIAVGSTGSAAGPPAGRRSSGPADDTARPKSGRNA